MITENKLKHTIGVARKCRELAEELHLSEQQCDAAFVMGFLHDIGYEHTSADNISEHPKEGYNMVINFLSRPDAAVAILKHGECPIEDMGLFDYILNTADLTVDHLGNPVSAEQRVQGIRDRYGNNSSHTQNAIRQTQAIVKYKEKTCN